MEPDVVANYVAQAQRLTRHFVLLRNSVSGKRRAARADDIGVVTPVLEQSYLSAFDQFELVGADSTAFGSVGPGQFVSECMVLQRKAASK